MRVYLDESGNTGGVSLNKKKKLNFGKQKYFVYGAVVVNDLQDEEILINKYRNFKKRYFNILKDGEIKGNDLLIRDNNDALNSFIKDIVDDEHFFVNIYDKKFYISTLILLGTLGFEFRTMFPVEYYSIASELCKYDDVLTKYAELSFDSSDQKIRMFLRFLKNEIENNDLFYALLYVLNELLKNNDIDDFKESILGRGSYNNVNYSNLINMNALGEEILEVKTKSNICMDKLKLYIDRIDGIDREMVKEMENHGFKIEIVEDSKTNELIQLADNIASIFYKLFSRVTETFISKSEWEEKSEWNLTTFARIYRKMNLQNIKVTTPIQDWSLSLVVSKMFSTEYPREMRSNFYFNYENIEAQKYIMETLDSINFDIEHIDQKFRS